MRTIKRIGILGLLLAVCLLAYVSCAAAENHSRTVTTDIVIDGENFVNSTLFTWEEEYPIPEGSLVWDGNPDYIFMPAFDREALVELPPDDPASLVATYYVRNNIFFTAADGADFNTIQQLAAQYGFRIIGYLAPTGQYLVQSVADKSYDELQAVISAFRKHEAVAPDAVALEYVEVCALNSYYPNDPWGNATWNDGAPGGNNWGVEAIHAPDAWSYRDRMAELTVGVMDGFISPTHEDLNIRIITSAFSDFWEVFGAYNLGSVSGFSHGTHVSGTFAGRFDNETGVSGVFPHGRILAGCFDYLKDDVESIVTSDALTMYYMLMMRANDVKVINMSYGLNLREWRDYQRILHDSAYRDDLYAALQSHYSTAGWVRFMDRLEQLNDWDFVFVHSAGNQKTDAKLNGWPEAIKGMSSFFSDRLITVGSYGKKDWAKDGDQYAFSSFSNHGMVDILAPGERIYSSVIGLPPFRDSWYQSKYFSLLGKTDYWNGTSQASPHVAGTAAMIWSLAPDTFTAPQVKQILLQNANTKDALISGRTEDMQYGKVPRYPLLDAGKAVKAAVAILDESAPIPTMIPEATPTAVPENTPTPTLTAAMTPTPITTPTPTPAPTSTAGYITFTVRYEDRNDLTSVQYALYYVEKDYYPKKGATTALSVRLPTALLPAGHYELHLSKQPLDYETEIVEFELPASGASIDLGTITLKRATATPSVTPANTLYCTLSVAVVDDMTTYTLQCQQAKGAITDFNVSVSNKNILLLDTREGLIDDTTIIQEDTIIFQLDDELVNGAVMTVNAADASGQTFSGAMYLAIGMDGTYTVPAED